MDILCWFWIYSSKWLAILNSGRETLLQSLQERRYIWQREAVDIWILEWRTQILWWCLLGLVWFVFWTTMCCIPQCSEKWSTVERTGRQGHTHTRVWDALPSVFHIAKKSKLCSFSHSIHKEVPELVWKIWIVFPWISEGTISIHITYTCI